MSYILSAHPHFKSADSTRSIMFTVTASLVPAGLWSIHVFGVHSLFVIVTAILSAAFFEYLARNIVFKSRQHISDGSSILTGLLMAYCLPPDLPLWQVVLGSFFAVFVAKECFGGLGQNIFNPALIGRAALLASFPVSMTAWQLDGVTTATPLAVEKGIAGSIPAYLDLFIGDVPGSLGEVSKGLLLLGGLFLLARRIISWHIPVSFFAAVLVFSLPFGRDPLREALSGGVFLGAFFMATDYVTSPIYSRGKLLFGAGCGLLTMLIRCLGAYPEGVCYAILIMNILVPLIDKWTPPAVFGTTKESGRAS